ncbi:MBL fold metallo-hydrolase [Lentimicrobium sp.]
MKITFIGGAQQVTGSKFLIETDKGKKILLDCGIFQGKGLETDAMNRDLPFSPGEIDYILLTHAHIDHSGLIPYMYHLGFRGSVICTNATRDLCSIMLADSGHIQESDTHTFNKKRAREGKPAVEPLYTPEDARQSLELFVGMGYKRIFQPEEDLSLEFTNTGHMLGSGVVNLSVKEAGKTIRIAYTGDVGRPYNRILKPPAPFPQADYLITEATYGNRLHPPAQNAEEELLEIVKHTCVTKKGKLIIPSFAIGRTQELVLVLNNYFNEGRLPRVPIYVDSPLAVNATDIFRLHPECFNREVMEVMENDPDPFGFGSLRYIRKVSESKNLNRSDAPMVIISASGMMEAGRIKHHLANNISNPRNTVLAVGYCADGTLGHRLIEGEKEVSIFGNIHHVKADIRKIEAFSGHADYKEMADFLECQDKQTLKKIFLVHGEPDALNHYSNYLASRQFSNISIPAAGQAYGLS